MPIIFSQYIKDKVVPSIHLHKYDKRINQIQNSIGSNNLSPNSLATYQLLAKRQLVLSE